MRMCLAQPGYGSGLLPPVYLNFSSILLFLLVFSNKLFVSTLTAPQVNIEVLKLKFYRGKNLCTLLNTYSLRVIKFV